MRARTPRTTMAATATRMSRIITYEKFRQGHFTVHLSTNPPWPSVPVERSDRRQRLRQERAGAGGGRRLADEVGQRSAVGHPVVGLGAAEEGGGAGGRALAAPAGSACTTTRAGLAIGTCRTATCARATAGAGAAATRAGRAGRAATRAGMTAVLPGLTAAYARRPTTCTRMTATRAGRRTSGAATTIGGGVGDGTAGGECAGGNENGHQGHQVRESPISPHEPRIRPWPPFHKIVEARSTFCISQSAWPAGTPRTSWLAPRSGVARRLQFGLR